MSQLSENTTIQDLITARITASTWTEESLIRYVRFHIDGALESGYDDDGGVFEAIGQIDISLSKYFHSHAEDITADDIEAHLNAFIDNLPNADTHLSIARSMIEANPKAANQNQVEKLRTVLEEPEQVRVIVQMVPNERIKQAEAILALVA